jgi:hypothetical protein
MQNCIVTSDERDIFQFLKTWSSMFISSSEIARRVGGRKRVHADPRWAKPILVSMADRGILETDLLGRYRIKPVRRKKREKWVAPDIAKILAEHNLPIPGEHAAGHGASGNVAAVTGGEGEIAEDDYYEQL